MQRLLAAVLAAILVGTAGLSAAQTLNTDLSDGWVGDEPNTATPGALPFCFPRGGKVDPSCDYPEDANGLGPDRGPAANGGSPAKVLAVSWENRIADPVGPSVPFHTAPLLQPLLGNDMMVPGFGQFVAWFGTFQDHNDNGWIEDHLAADRVEATTRGNCETTVATDDDNGVGSPQDANTGVSARCVQEDEWAPGDVVIIAAYVTPGDFNEEADYLNAPTEGPHNDTSQPDIFFQSFDVDGERTGRYYAPASNFEYVVIDNGVLETTVLEAISEPENVVNGDRSAEAKAGSLVEVDVYTSVNPAVEALYENNVVSVVTAAGCDVDFTYFFDLFSPGPILGGLGPCGPGQQAVVDEVDGAAAPVTGPVEQVLEDAGVNDAVDGATGTQTDPTVGPVSAAILTNGEFENGQNDYSSPHLYLDQRLVTSAAWSLGNVAPSNSGFLPGLSGNPDGKDHAWTQSTLIATLGVWEDKDGDGFIGTFEEDHSTNLIAVTLTDVEDDGCPDMYDCGNGGDPNDYTSDEFTALCGANEAPARKALATYLADLNTPDGNWGLGVYVITDRVDVTNGDTDPMADDGRAPFNPYDDAVLDASDASVDSLHRTGPLQLHMGCTTGGAYQSYERLIVLDGVNRGYDIIHSGSTGGDFSSQGVPVGERASDTDVVAAWGV